MLSCSAVVLAAAGCGEDQIDTAKAEDEIARAIASQTGLAVESVECPDDVEAERGGTFECTATGANGGEAKVQVSQTDDEGNIRFQAPDLRALGAPTPGGTPTTPGGEAPGGAPTSPGGEAPYSPGGE